MLDMGFMPDIRRIIALLPPVRQNLMFSATFPEEIRKLAATILNNPAEVQVAARNAVAELVTHIVHPVAREKKRELLCHLIRSRNLSQVLVFTGTRIGANRLAHQLRREHIHADAIHGDKSQAERLVALEDFKAGKVAVLVATDVASRGLDIEGLPQVINFDVPHSPEDYVHRIGRTGRAGMAGEAISLVAPDDQEKLAAIEKLIKRKIERVLVPGFTPDGGTVAGMIGHEGTREGAREGGRGPRREPRPREAPKREAPRREPAPRREKSVDPIFSKPYEPAQTAVAAPEPHSAPSRRKQRPVAALLGGVKRAADG